MSNPESAKMLDASDASVVGPVNVDYWNAEYDWKSDTFVLAVYWQGYGYGQRMPAASFAAVVALFEAASRARSAVYFNGLEGKLRLSIAPIPV